MKSYVALAVACLLLSSGAHASRPLHGRELKAVSLSPDQGLSLLVGVSDLVNQIAQVGAFSKLDDAVDEVALLKFLQSILASAGVKNTPLDAILNGDNLEDVLQGEYTDTVVKGVAQAVQTLSKGGSVTSALTPLLKAVSTSFTDFNAVGPLAKLLDFNGLFKGLGLPIDGSALTNAVDLEKVAGLVSDLLISIVNGYIQLATQLDPTGSQAAATAQAASSKAGVQLPAMATKLLGALG